MSSPYIKQIRKKIGNDFLMLPSVTVLVMNEEKKIMLVRHSAHNVWVAPGGMIEPDERPEDAAIREMQEEIGCTVKLTGILGTYGGPKFRMQYPNGDQVGYVMTLYEAEIISGELKPDGEEILEIKFFTYEETKALPTEDWVPVALKDVFENKKYYSL